MSHQCHTDTPLNAVGLKHKSLSPLPGTLRTACPAATFHLSLHTVSHLSIIPASAACCLQLHPALANSACCFVSMGFFLSVALIVFMPPLRIFTLFLSLACYSFHFICTCSTIFTIHVSSHIYFCPCFSPTPSHRIVKGLRHYRMLMLIIH